MRKLISCTNTSCKKTADSYPCDDKYRKNGENVSN